MRAQGWARALGAGLWLATGAGAAQAQEAAGLGPPPVGPTAAAKSTTATTPPAPPPPPTWSVDAGGLGLFYPRFAGGRGTRFLGLPIAEAHYGDDLVFATVRDGLGFVAHHWGTVEVGPVANVAFPRNARLDPAALHGLHEIPWTVEAGAFARYDPAPWVEAKVESRQGLGGHKGLVTAFSLALYAPPGLSNRLFIEAGPRFDLYNGQYARANYGLTALDALRSGQYAAYTPASGWQAGGTLAAIYAFRPRFAFTAFTEYGYLGGGAGRSPLVRGRYGTVSQWTTGLVLTYRLLGAGP